ncbi:3-hydroxyacyl-ACP dehydratase FabZ family protein [Engelhardtia mirabilis]|uniref:3-hydroxyacyl-[acyl-carrier-protein] dehydratase FabZ n=1 Tax=Engelhardtia mirabilis TaxID=2528011 RepID=A0A518BIF6_9BACT|nr:3-hydroxyacyl-[acyl-carrier-protein] dehydratase FabZ [Planctomycetes bacterium Pla133]QDV01049.1 3-hydroxyacyl-[acyl-carrier-protein] dehydratase FabZ [Planctomycetes bacterium Pla86]
MTQSTRLEAPADRAAIEAAIPHREPFLLVDEVLEAQDERIVTRWTVPADADWFRGHYPGQPVTPGVLLCEHALQSGALLVSRALAGFDAGDGVPVVTKLEGARFRRMVLPGETVETEVKLVERLGPAWILRGVVRCGGKKAVDLSFVLSAAGAMGRVDR